MELPKRKQNRLTDFDYSQNGAYFITICSKDKECIFSKVINDTNTVGVRVSGGHLCIYAEAPTEPAGETGYYPPANLTTTHKRYIYKTMENLPKRKPNRLSSYDYSQNGAYFITICSKDKKCIFSRISVGADIIRPQQYVHLTKIGKIVEYSIKSIPSHYDGIYVDNYVIMPNHIHLIIRIDNDGGRMVSAPTVIGSFKRFVSKQVGKPIWQKGFYDHIIRDEYDYQTKWKYIDDNPIKWADDELYQAIAE